MKKALITGVTGQDGSYLADFLLAKGYEVHGFLRSSSTYNRSRIEHLLKNANFFLHYGDMTDSSTLLNVLSVVKPDEIYNLAAQSHVKISFEIPEYTSSADALGVLKLLEAVRTLGLNSKIYQASTSELYGRAQETPQKETTPFNPLSPYAVAKLYSYWIIKSYRESYGIYACNGILFNHESPRRGINFVTRKITRTVAAINHGIEDKLVMGNINSIRDWGYSPDYVEMMWLMLQQDKPDDYVISTGEGHTVREFIEASFEHIGIKIKWTGSGVDEKGLDEKTGRVLVEIHPKYFRPNEVELLIGDSSKARNKFGWSPKIKFKELVKIMMDYDLKKVSEFKSLDFN